MQLLVCLFLILRVSWRKNFFTIFIFQLDVSLTSIRLEKILDSNFYLLTGILINIILLWVYSYKSEKQHRILFYDSLMYSKSTEIFKELFRNVLPQSVFVIRDSELIFHNKASQILLNSSCSTILSQNLNKIYIDFSSRQSRSQ